MARSRKAPKARPATLPRLLEDLPDRFTAPEVSDDLLGSLRDYLDDLESWVIDEGVASAEARTTALDIMASIGTSPSSWYRMHAEGGP